jgi:hypothetical protein
VRGLVIALLLPLAVTPVLLTALEEGPLPGFTGGFGEKSCTACHFDGPLNDPAGSLQIAGLPAEFTAGQQYSITVSVRRAELRRAGFELSSRYGTGSHRGEDAGTLAAPTDRLQIVTSKPPKHNYIQHTKVGAQAATPGAVSWTFVWTAPARPAGTVVFNVAANASNADSSPSGDFIYTTEVRSERKASDYRTIGLSDHDR